MKKLGFVIILCILASGCGGTSSLQPPSSPSLSHTPYLKATDLETIAWIGDSYAVQNNITTPFQTALQSQYGMGGYGWVDLYYLSTTQPGITIGAAGTWIRQRQTADSTGLNISDVRTTDTTTPAQIIVSVQSNTSSATLFYYEQPGGGTFQWWVDSATPMTIETAAAAPAIGTSVISGLSNTEAHTFQIQLVSAGISGIRIEGLNLRSSTSGVVVHNLGSAGSDTGNWVNVNAETWEAQLAAVQPTLVVVMLSPNDQADGISASDQATNLTALVSRIHTAVPGIPIILAPPPDNGLNRTPSMPEYNDSQKALAQRLKIGYIDVLDDMGAFNPAYFNSDLLHPNVQGGEMIAQFVLGGINHYLASEF